MNTTKRDLTKMRPGTLRKYAAIQARFKHLYDVERIRYDDCIARLMEEFFIESRVTISVIMCMDIPEIKPYVDPNQMSLFPDITSTQDRPYTTDPDIKKRDSTF